MGRQRLMGMLWGALLFAAGMLVGQATVPEAASPGPVSEKVILLMDEEFEKLLKPYLDEQAVRYGGTREELLRQIAVATRYTVKTNFLLIQQNNEIIRLLQQQRR